MKDLKDTENNAQNYLCLCVTTTTKKTELLIEFGCS